MTVLPCAAPCRVGAALRAAPLTAAFLGLLLVTTVLQRHFITNDDAVLRWASTNIDNLASAPIRSIVASALFLQGGHWLPTALELGLTLGLLERRFGATRAVAVFASAHVLATLLTEGGEWVAVRSGEVAESARSQLDVGISYGLWASIAAVLVLLPLRFRVPAAAVLGAVIVTPLLVDYDMTAAGHVLSFAIGLAWWPYLLRRSRRLLAGSTRASVDMAKSRDRSATEQPAEPAAAPGHPADAVARGATRAG